MIAIFDYGAGNLRSVENTLAEIGAAYTLVRDADGLQCASKIILPGVGHFERIIRAIDTRGVRETFLNLIRAGIPFLGICLGMQALFEWSEEAPGVPGLGVFPGGVQRFPLQTRVPHVGWNELVPRGESLLLAGTGPRPHVYFAHSYYVPETPETKAVCTYMLPYTAVLEAGNVFGVQFHPEKSGSLGIRIMKNFADL